jgi:hypothetical protein
VHVGIGEFQLAVSRHLAVIHIGPQVGAVAADHPQPVGDRVEVDGRPDAFGDGGLELGLARRLRGDRIDGHHGPVGDEAVEEAIRRADVDAEQLARQARDLGRLRHFLRIGVDDGEGVVADQGRDGLCLRGPGEGGRGEKAEGKG